jgi:hypothetical protein
MAEQLMKTEINCTTGEEIVRPLTEEEIAQLEIDRVASAKWEEERVARQAKLSALKESAKTKLVAGEPLTEEEAAVIVL